MNSGKRKPFRLFHRKSEDRPLAALPAIETPNPPFDVAHAIKLLYGDQASDGLLAKLTAGELKSEANPRRIIRSTLGTISRDEAETPFTVRATADDIIWKSIEGQELALDRDDLGVSRHIMADTYEHHVQMFLSRTLRGGMSFIDVGANVGFHTLNASRLVGPNGRVVAFEPSSENCRLILLSAARNSSTNITLRPLALSDSAGYIVFATALGSNGGKAPLGYSGLEAPSCMIVPTMRLDDCKLDSCDVMKIDVEGAESLVIAGAVETIRAKRPVIVLEFCPLMIASVAMTTAAEFLSRMRGLGYSVALLKRAGDVGAEESIPGDEDFLANYGSDHRIEDLVFRPV